jgi:hypothetical protein
VLINIWVVSGFCFISKAAITFFCHTFLLGVVVHTYNPSTQKAEAGGS